MRKIRLIILFTAIIMTLPIQANDSFVKVKDGTFVRNGKPYYYIGTNFWYGAILGSVGQGGNRQRLCKELDAMKACGIDNLRILVGSDGKRGVPSKVEPTLQIEPGVYNDTILAGLDYLLMQMQKRQMVAVLYLNNSWEWSGGYGFYLEHVGMDKTPVPSIEGYDKYMDYASQFADNEKAHNLFYNYVRFILGRTNRFTHKKYVDDPSIMSWQIGNEPRAFSKKAIPGFVKWLSETSALIRSIDKNHLISIGSEGYNGCELDYAVVEKTCEDKNVDYCNIHVWPYNWGWTKKDSVSENITRACINSKEYIQKHIDICDKLNKPLVMEEFGYPRDGFSFSPSSATSARDKYYDFVFSIVVDNAIHKTRLAGCNFWGWGGYAKPSHEKWQVGDDYCGDPAQEQQGLNSVFIRDKETLDVVSRYTNILKKLK
jgi:mannan endo-1,4-beta-mannosidase